MRKKNILIIISVIAIILLTACRKDANEDLFKQQQERQLAKNQTEPDNQERSDSQAEGISVSVSPTQEPKEPEDGKEGSSSTAVATDGTSEALNQKETKDTHEAYIDGKTLSEGEAMEVAGQKELQLFYYEELSDEIKARINGKSYGENCDVPYSELRYVQVLHYGFDGEIHTGELIVNQAIAEDTLEIFKELYDIKYPIERMVLVDEYDADDNTSMEANNTSAFNFRFVEGTSRRSLHSDGIAIDINPQYNPYIHKLDGEVVVTPVNGVEYADRTLDCEYFIHKDDPCYQAFISRGFTWGGEWKNSQDYQHFQKIIE